MNRNAVIMWVGRIIAVLFTAAVIRDITTDQQMGEWLRLSVLVIVTTVFVSLAAWQGAIARKYDGWPIIPLSFRWVVFTWFASFALFVVWTLATTVFDALYTDLRSAVMWWQLATSTLWFASRWITVQTPHAAGAGETGSGASRSTRG